MFRRSAKATHLNRFTQHSAQPITGSQERNQRLERVAVLKTVTQRTKIIKMFSLKKSEELSRFLNQNENVLQVNCRSVEFS